MLLAYGKKHISLLRSLVADRGSVVPLHTILEVFWWVGVLWVDGWRAGGRAVGLVPGVCGPASPCFCLRVALLYYPYPNTPGPATFVLLQAERHGAGAGAALS